jgi:hypothetical protein
MTVESKVRIYKMCIRPILTYVAETRAETSKTKRILKTAEMRTLRAARGISLKDRIRKSPKSVGYQGHKGDANRTCHYYIKKKKKKTIPSKLEKKTVKLR